MILRSFALCWIVQVFFAIRGVMESMLRVNDSSCREGGSRKGRAIVMTGFAARTFMSVKTAVWHVAGAGSRVPARRAAEVIDPRGSDREKCKWCGFDGESRPSVASCCCPEFGFLILVR